MTHKDLNEVMENTIREITELMSNKQQYYVKDGADAFENFCDAKNYMPLDSNETMPQIAVKYMRKHWTKLMGIIFKQHNYSLDLLSEIINDIIIYLILIKAMLTEQHNTDKEYKTMSFQLK